MSNNPVRIFDSQGRPLATTAVGDGTYKLQVDTELTATVDPTGLATSAKQTEIAALVGEVQTSPTANTLLARLKDILSGVVLAAGTNLIGKVGIDQVTDHANEVVVKRNVQLHANIDIIQATAYTAIAAPGAGYRLRICQILLMSGASTPVNSEVAIKSGSTIIKTVKGASIALDFPEHCNLGTNEALVLLPTTADRIVGGVDYYVEAV